MYHAACRVEFQPFNRPYSRLTFFNVWFFFFNRLAPPLYMDGWVNRRYITLYIHIYIYVLYCMWFYRAALVTADWTPRRNTPKDIARAHHQSPRITPLSSRVTPAYSYSKSRANDMHMAYILDDQRTSHSWSVRDVSFFLNIFVYICLCVHLIVTLVYLMSNLFKYGVLTTINMCMYWWYDIMEYLMSNVVTYTYIVCAVCILGSI